MLFHVLELNLIPFNIGISQSINHRIVVVIQSIVCLYVGVPNMKNTQGRLNKYLMVLQIVASTLIDSLYRWGNIINTTLPKRINFHTSCKILLITNYDLRSALSVVHAIAQSHSHIPHLITTSLLWVNYIRLQHNNKLLGSILMFTTTISQINIKTRQGFQLLYSLIQIVVYTCHVGSSSCVI